MKRLLFVLLIVFFNACSSSEVKEALDIADGVERKTIDVSRLGVNSFANDGRFGSISSQFRTVRDTLGLKYIRVLFNWGDAIQASPGSQPNFSFYDDISASIPNGVSALVVLTGLPSWMSSSSNWIDGDPRKTFVELWVRKVINRYSSNPRIIGFQIWNEPNQSRNENEVLDVRDSPENYVEMLAMAHNVIKEKDESKLVLNASTTAIAQEFPSTLDYNIAMAQAGVLQFVDIFAFHYYGRLFERIFDVRKFLNSLEATLWITESGIQGVNNQLAYGEQVWPFLRENINNLDLIFIYQHTEATSPESTFGLENLNSEL
ncbi:MAG: cellulase family glycosylhydrolase, partial [Bdellovibrionales bacterium]|nr:cellulase family glycosylhydrolase [Bdellovibrionales bacterium]